jgi:hypothetical protein
MSRLRVHGEIRQGAADERSGSELKMSYDALVWLLVGLGIGVAASLMLLLGYSMLEYGRLSRRFRRARAAAAAAATPVTETLPVAPKTSLLAPPAPRANVVARLTAPANDVRPVAGRIRATDDTTARPTPVSVPPAKPAEVAEPRPSARAVETQASAAPPPAVVVAEVKRPQSVEAMFAEAFANDRLTASPEPDEAAGAAKPDSGKPPA